MGSRFALFSLLISIGLLQLAAAWGDAPSAPADEQFLLLRNGEVLRGRVSLQADHYVLTLAHGEVRVRVNEVETVCRDLDEAYRYRRSRLVASRADDHLDLAAWCLRQALPGDAARELSAALALDPRNPRIALIDRQLQESLNPPAAEPKVVAAVPTKHLLSTDELDRMVRSLPAGSVESYTTLIQPLLMSNCATAGCHGPGAKGGFALMRAPADRFGNRRVTQRNLQSTLTWLDFQNPAASRLLNAAATAHGAAPGAVFDPQSARFRELVAWVAVVTQRPLETPPEAQPATVNPRGAVANDGSNSSGDLPPTTAANRDPRPLHAARKGLPPVIVNVHPDGSTDDSAAPPSGSAGLNSPSLGSLVPPSSPLTAPVPPLPGSAAIPNSKNPAPVPHDGQGR